VLNFIEINLDCFELLCTQVDSDFTDKKSMTYNDENYSNDNYNGVQVYVQVIFRSMQCATSNAVEMIVSC